MQSAAHAAGVAETLRRYIIPGGPNADLLLANLRRQFSDDVLHEAGILVPAGTDQLSLDPGTGAAQVDHSAGGLEGQKRSGRPACRGRPVVARLSATAGDADGTMEFAAASCLSGAGGRPFS